MIEKWNYFVYDLCEAKKRDVEEEGFHALIETQLQHLGWAKYNHTTIQVHHTTSKEQAKNKRLKKFLMAIGENGANLKALMDDMDLRNRSSFVNTYIAPNLAEGYIAMLYPESPNHPMQSYYLTNKGRELLERL